ncbi:hypothetical protein GCM10010446_28210 [Streptomyces enissocaesilis]|uniref:Uncharacterized protein n=1 Tax=Streptomyces enissocaesilis TaxID=332589 RepID=A0ABN3X9D3_9ACTN
MPGRDGPRCGSGDGRVVWSQVRTAPADGGGPASPGWDLHGLPRAVPAGGGPGLPRRRDPRSGGGRHGPALRAGRRSGICGVSPGVAWKAAATTVAPALVGAVFGRL